MSMLIGRRADQRSSYVFPEEHDNGVRIPNLHLLGSTSRRRGPHNFAQYEPKKQSSDHETAVEHRKDLMVAAAGTSVVVLRPVLFWRKDVMPCSGQRSISFLASS
jgi:hypothetical protein